MIGQQVSANFTCNKHLQWLVWGMKQCQPWLGFDVVVVVVESPPPVTGRTPVEKRMIRITMPMTTIATKTQMIVQRVLRHHILRCTRWDVFLNVAAFTATNIMPHNSLGQPHSITHSRNVALADLLVTWLVICICDTDKSKKTQNCKVLCNFFTYKNYNKTTNLTQIKLSVKQIQNNSA